MLNILTNIQLPGNDNCVLIFTNPTKEAQRKPVFLGAYVFFGEDLSASKRKGYSRKEKFTNPSETLRTTCDRGVGYPIKGYRGGGDICI